MVIERVVEVSPIVGVEIEYPVLPVYDAENHEISHRVFDTLHADTEPLVLGLPRVRLTQDRSIFGEGAPDNIDMSVPDSFCTNGPLANFPIHRLVRKPEFLNRDRGQKDILPLWCKINLAQKFTCLILHHHTVRGQNIAETLAVGMYPDLYRKCFTYLN